MAVAVHTWMINKERTRYGNISLAFLKLRINTEFWNRCHNEVA
jgi:hypothetical protein